MMPPGGSSLHKKEASFIISAEEISSFSLRLENDEEFMELFDNSPTLFMANSFDSVLSGRNQSTAVMEAKPKPSSPNRSQNRSRETKKETERNPIHRQSRQDRQPNERRAIIALSNSNTSSRPKRPVTAYNLFFKWKRRELLKGGDSKEENLTFSTIGKLIGVEWKNLCQSDRVEYERQAKRDQIRYRRELTAWKKEQRHQRRNENMISQQQGRTQTTSDSPLEARSCPGSSTSCSSRAAGAFSSGGSSPLSARGEIDIRPDQQQWPPHRSFSPKVVSPLEENKDFTGQPKVKAKHSSTFRRAGSPPPALAGTTSGDCRVPSASYPYGSSFPWHNPYQSAFNQVYHNAGHAISPSMHFQSQGNFSDRDHHHNYYQSHSTPPPPAPPPPTPSTDPHSSNWYWLPYPTAAVAQSAQPSAAVIGEDSSSQQQRHFYSDASYTCSSSLSMQPFHTETTHWPTTSPPPPLLSSNLNVTFQRYRITKKSKEERCCGGFTI